MPSLYGPFIFLATGLTRPNIALYSFILSLSGDGLSVEGDGAKQAHYQ